ncbi:MAG TPA: heavy metal-binding domain-containing protein [Phycisphaerae bacterium]|nr:heavy metal-binding domain-containing protein [Phycisphaerae bacterium]
MFTRIAVLMGILLAGTLAGGEGMTTTPASTEHVASQAELDGCLQHCREAFSQIEETLRIMEAARDRDDPEELQRAMAAARSKLIAARRQVSRSMQTLEALSTQPASRDGSARRAEPVSLSEQWACLMHSQVRQNKPGNCVICDATLVPVAIPPAATRPAIVSTPSDKSGIAGDSIREATTGR